MERKTWKWIIEELPSKFRAEMIAKMDIQIAGFRKEALLVGNGKAKLTATLLQPRYRMKLKLYLLDHGEELGRDLCFLDMGEEDLQDFARKGKGLSALLTLLLQPEEEVIDKGENLYHWMEKEGLLNVHREQRDPSSDKGEKGTAIAGTYDSKRIKRMEEKINRLREDNEEHQDYWKGKQLEWKKEKQGLTTEITKLKSQFRELEKIKQDLQKELSTVMGKWEEMKRLSRKPVALIGNPHSQKVSSSSRYSIRIIEAKEVEQAIADKQLKDVEEIWILTYKTPIGKIRMVRGLKSPEKIMEFSTFIDLERYIE